MIDFDPAQRFRQRHAVGARVQPGAEIKDGVHALGDGLLYECVDDAGADDDGPPAHHGLRRQAGDDRPAAFARQFVCERIAKQGIRAFAFDGAIGCRHEGGVGDVLDGGVCHVPLVLEAIVLLGAEV